MQDWLFAAGHDGIWLSANPDPSLRAHGFYRRLGWRADGSHRPGDENLILPRPTARVT